MATRKEKDVESATAQPELEKALEVGYLGDRVDPLPDERHSLESGPDAPSISEQRAALAEADAANASSSSSSEDGDA